MHTKNGRDQEVIYTLEELEKLCEQYQALLGLQDWDVEICFANQMTIPEYEAQVATESKSKRALISIISPETFASLMNAKQNMHHALIHELLHLHFVTYFRPASNSVEERLFELALNKIAGAFCELKVLPGAPAPGTIKSGVHAQTLLETTLNQEETNDE